MKTNVTSVGWHLLSARFDRAFMAFAYTISGLIIDKKFAYIPNESYKAQSKILYVNGHRGESNFTYSFMHIIEKFSDYINSRIYYAA